MGNRPAVRLALVAVCLVGCLVFVTAPAAAADDIEVENALSQSNTDGAVDVTTRLSIPESTAWLELTLPEGTDVYDSNGFERVDDRTYEWTETTAEPSLSYEYEGTVRSSGDREGVRFVAAEEWALVRTPGVRISAEAIEGTEIVRENTVDGEGIASTHMAYLGSYTEHVGSAAGQEIRLVVPEAAELRSEPDEIIETLEFSAKRLAIGEREPSVFVVAAPTGEHAWASAGLQIGDGGDMWVRDAEPVGTARDTWIHEYVHTRQEYAQRPDADTTAETRWTVEGMADYYAALLSYETGAIGYGSFRDRLEKGATEHPDVRLAEPETWAGTDANYDRGALVFAFVDRRLRIESGTTLDAVVARLNDREGELTQRRFLDAIGAAGGSELRADVERYTETTATPPIATRSEHVAAFGGPDVRYAIEGASVSGPYRTGALGGNDTLVVGETLGLNVTAENAGTEPGSFEAELRIDGEAVSTATGRLDAGESTRLRFEHAFESAGEFEVSIGSERRTVRVAEPADVEVTALDTEPATPAPGESVTLRATVRSSADRPASGEVVFAVDGESVATEPVRVADGSVLVEATVTLESAGEYRVSAGGRSTTVVVEAVEEPETTGAPDGPTPPSVDDQAGFGPASAVVALVVAFTLALLSRRR
jgi:hypothetical protein